MIELKNNEKFLIKKDNANEEFNVAPFSNVEVEIEDFEGELNLDFFVQEGAQINLKLLNLNCKKTINLKGNVCRTGLFFINIADFIKGEFDIKSNIILYGDDARSEVRFSSLVNEKFRKNYDISFSHIGKHTESILEGYGVSQDEGNLVVKGVSHIEKDSIKSKANQLVKVILFDELSKAKASPILKIDCDDIKANHGCAIGALNQEHLYYLMSRGLTINESKRLITQGYLLPIAKNFNKDEQQLIINTIEGSI